MHIGPYYFTFIYDYHPAVRRRLFSRFGNGFTIWVANCAAHFWKLSPREYQRVIKAQNAPNEESENQC